MVYGVVLAGGAGKRMQRSDLPKQFLPLGGKPVIVHTVEQFFIHPRIDRSIAVVPREWMAYTQDLFSKSGLTGDGLYVAEGGADRNASLMAAAAFIRDRFGVGDGDVVVSHDAVRPFLTQRIIDDNIDGVLECGAADTVVAASDTIVCSQDGKYISSIPVRGHMYQGQTPQSFRITLLEEVYSTLTDDEKIILTDSCKMMVLKGHQVKLVRGELFNIKITTEFDLDIAHALLRGEKA